MIAELIIELNQRYEHWSFAGDLVKWHHAKGQWRVRRFEVVTPGVQDTFRFGGRTIFVHSGEPTPSMFGEAGDVKIPAPVRGSATRTDTKTCPHRSLEQIDTIKCDQCGQGKGQLKPVYACAIHGRCTHRLERRGQQTQEVPTWICVGCKDGPWAPV